MAGRHEVEDRCGSLLDEPDQGRAQLGVGGRPGFGGQVRIPRRRADGRFRRAAGSGSPASSSTGSCCVSRGVAEQRRTTFGSPAMMLQSAELSGARAKRRPRLLAETMREFGIVPGVAHRPTVLWRSVWLLSNDDLIADLEARGLIHDSTDREHLRAQVAEGPGRDLLRLRPDRRQPARRQPDRVGDAAPVPGRRAHGDRARRRCDRHGRRPERPVRGAQPARRRHARPQRRVHQGADSAGSSTCRDPAAACSSTTATGPSRSRSSSSSATSAST